MDKSFVRTYSFLLVLIALNIILFITIGLSKIIFNYDIAELFVLYGDFSVFLKQPWGILSYMFVQIDFLHLLFNMLWLWAFGTIICRFDNSKILIPTYIISGIFGGLAFLCVTLTTPTAGPLLGSSASVLGVIAGSASRNGRLKLNLILLGNIELRWIVIAAIIFCGVLTSLGNVCVLSAHLAGAAAGWLFSWIMMRKKSKISIFRKKSESKSFNVRQQERRGLRASEQSELDVLLSRVGKSGYKSLSMSDRRRLFELSNKINRQ